jgi:hypothetical protein
MSTRDLFWGGKGWPASRADNLTVTCEPNIFRKCGSLDVSESYVPSRPVTGIASTSNFSGGKKLIITTAKSHTQKTELLQPLEEIYIPSTVTAFVRI